MLKRLYWGVILRIYLFYCRIKYSDFHQIINYTNPEQFTFTVKIIESLLN